MWYSHKHESGISHRQTARIWVQELFLPRVVGPWPIYPGDIPKSVKEFNKVKIFRWKHRKTSDVIRAITLLPRKHPMLIFPQDYPYLSTCIRLHSSGRGAGSIHNQDFSSFLSTPKGEVGELPRTIDSVATSPVPVKSTEISGKKVQI